MKVLIMGILFFTSLSKNETAILRNHLNHAKILLFVGQRKFLYFSDGPALGIEPMTSRTAVKNSNEYCAKASHSKTCSTHGIWLTSPSLTTGKSPIKIFDVPFKG